MLALFSHLDLLAWLYELATRVCSLWPTQMYGRRARLSSIPERCEEEEPTVTKWVPKQKHEALKAKYKCLKKLFQVYDASLVNMLPDPYIKPEISASRESKTSERSHRSSKKKRKTHRRKESEKYCTDREKECACAAGALMKDLKIKKCTLGPTLTDQVGIAESKRQFCNVKSIKAESSDLSTVASLDANDDLDYRQTAKCALKQPAQQLVAPMQQMFYQPPKLNMMQMLKYRLFGHRPKTYRCNMGHIQSLSDPTMLGWGAEPTTPAARPRRLLRLRRHRANRTSSCDALTDPTHPVVLNYSQSVQQNCLLDNTVRQCPFPGCSMRLNGIINYNDHLRLCHFPERKFVCHYCHECFETEHEKFIHENEHIGIFKKPIKNNTPKVIYENFKKNKTIISDEDKVIQCDVVREHKLKKIVSYFDKISTGDGSFVVDGHSFSKKTQPSHSQFCSEINYNKLTRSKHDCIQFNSCRDFFPSSGNFDHRASEKSVFACRMCGDLFRFQKELNTHVYSKHGPEAKRKHSSVCAFSLEKSSTCMDGQLNVNSIESCKARASSSDQTVKARRKELDASKSALSLDYDPSTNIVFYNTTSMESICNKKSSVFGKFVEKVKSVRSLQTPKWEESNRVIHI